MIKVFNSDDKTYETNGNVVLNPTYANIHKEDNGDYYLDLETSVEEDKIKHIEHEEGTTIETTGTTLTDVDTTKDHKFISLYGNTTQESTPTPSSPQPIHNVSGDNTIEICGKNLFDKDNKVVVEKKILNNSGVEVSDNSGGYTKMYIPVQSNTTYTISGVSSTGTKRIYFFDNTKTFISRTSQETSGQSSFSFTTPNNCKYIDIQFYYYSGYNLNTIQIEKGSTASEREAYTGNSQLISLGTIELCKISTYQDYIYKSNNIWYLHKEIGKHTITSSDEFTYQVFSNGNKRIYSQLGITNIKLPPSNDDISPIMCDNLIARVPNDLSVSGIYNTGISLATSGYFSFVSPLFTDLETAVGYMIQKSVYYVLATPTDTEITDTTLLEQLNNFEKMKLYNGITNISITPNDLTPNIKLHYNYIDGGDVVINNNDYIKSNNIIVANTPTGEQAFRITDIEKRKHKIVLKAWHISYDTKNYVIQDSYVVDKTCNQAMDHLNNATDNTSPFTTTSDITTINSYRCVRKSLFEAFNVVLERWGGHFVRDNWNFKIMNSIGQDNGVVVRYAKNLKDIQVTYDWTNVVTKILPVGNDGLLLDEVFLYADIQYDIPYTKVVHFDQNINEDDYRDEQGVIDEDAYLEALKNDLRSQATLYLQENYLPQVNYSLNANLEKITDIGDTIQVKDERLGVDITTNLISYDYDCILEKYTNLEFGNFTKTISDLTSYINSQTSQIVDESISTTRITLENELETATSQIWGVLGGSYVLNEGDKILIVDSLPKETATNVIMINSAGIGFSQTGINGTFSTALTIDGTFNTSNVNVINFTADLIKGGALKLGSNLNQNGILEVYDEANNLIAVLNKDGLRMNAVNGAYVLINQQVGFAGYDKNDNPIYWVSEDEFHMKKSVVEEEITLVDKMRIIPITITDNGTITNDGIGFVSTL